MGSNRQLGSRRSGQRSRWKSAVVASVVGVGSLVVVGLGVPAIASSADGSTTPAQAVGERLTRIKDALSGLVKDGTITQKQADKVAQTLDDKLGKNWHRQGTGMMGGWVSGEVDAVAKTLKLTGAQLTAQLHGGKTLAQIAKAQGVAVDTVVNQLVADAEAKIDVAVKAGHVRAAQATQVKANLKQRITNFVTNGGPLHGLGRGMMHGWGTDNS